MGNLMNKARSFFNSYLGWDYFYSAGYFRLKKYRFSLMSPPES